MKMLRRDPKRERGASLVEYGLLVGLVVIVAIVAVQKFGVSAKCKMCVNTVCSVKHPNSRWCSNETNMQLLQDRCTADPDQYGPTCGW